MRKREDRGMKVGTEGKRRGGDGGEREGVRKKRERNNREAKGE